MQFRNRRGTPVDPVPFLVVAALGFLVSFSYGPIYCMELGLAVLEALAVSAVAFLSITAFAYYRLVWVARPELRGELPAEYRLRALIYAALAVGALLCLLALPLFFRSSAP